MRNKYFIKEGQEELKRALLLMKYDSQKTLSENQENIKPLLQEDTVGAAVGSTAIGAGAGAALGAAGLIPGTAAVAGAGGTAFSIGTALGATSATGALALGGAVLGGAATLAVAPLAYWLIRKDSGSAASVKKLFQMCSSEAGKIAKLPRKINDTKIRNLADDINDAVNYQTLGFMAGTDEEKLFNAFRELRDGTASDACALINRYNTEYGDLYDDIDGDIDSPDEWKQIYRPLRDCVEDSLLSLKDESSNEDNKETPPPPKTKPSEQVKQTQEMLVGLGYYIGNTGPSKNGVDGYYGKKTDAAYKAWQSKESAQDFNNRVYKIGKTVTTQGTTTQGTTTQGGTQQGGTTQGGTQQGGTQQGGTQQGTAPEGEINIINPNDF